MKEISCYICSSKSKKTLVKQIKKDKVLTLINDKLNDLPRTIVQCLECGFVYHNPTLDSFELDILYKNYRNESFRKESPDQYFDRITLLPKDESENYKKTLYIDSLISKYSNFSNNKILNFYDVGTGGGVFIYSFLEHSKFIWQAFGCEPTPLYAELANRRLKCNVINSYYIPRLHPIKFDLITVNKVLEHSQDPLRFLSGLLWDLNDNGLLYIEVPSANEVFTLEADHPQLTYDHLIFFTLDTLEYLAKRADLDVLYMHEYERDSGEIDLIMLAKKRTEESNLLEIKPLGIKFH